MTDTVKNNKFNLQLTNFQSISSAKLQFEKGITLIIGASNSGKTASLRALKALLLNPNGTQRYIQHETDSASVAMDFNGNLVEWNRGKKDCKYIINGESHAKIGNTDLLTLLDDSGFVSDTDESIANIEGEWDTLFPFGKSGAELFKLFENVFCVADSAKIMQCHKQTESNITKEIQDCQESLNKDLIKSKALEEFQSKVDVSNLRDLKTILSKLYDEFASKGKSIKELDKLMKYIEAVPEGLEVISFSLLDITKYETMKKDLQTLKLIKDYMLCVKGVDKTIKTYSIDDLNKYIILKKDIKLLETIEKYSNVITDDSRVKIYDTNVIDKYILLKKDLKTLSNISELDTIKTDSELQTFNTDLVDKYKLLKNDLKKLKLLSDEVRGLKQQATELDKELVELNKELDAFGNCPTCGNVISKN